ncbi:MAG TPA: hypothetical protein VFD29_04070 [Gillisia sp.]|nr:hypothetical protein [Gillisia sp.]
MIIKGIKLAVAKLKIAQLVKNRQPEAYSIPVKSIGVIFDFKNRKALNQLEHLKKQLNISDVNFKVVTYIQNGKKPSNFEGDIYSLKNVNFDGEINNVGMNQFTSESVDLLITFAEEDNTAVHLLTAQCRAGIKVGRYQQNVALFDMIIQADNDAELFTEELSKYLKQLKKSQDE